jgi:hypothetical protein
MSSAKQSNFLLGKAPTNLAQVKEPPIYLLKEVAELLKVKRLDRSASRGFD